MLVPLTPLDFKRRATQLFGDNLGVVDRDVRYTYAEFETRTNRLAHALLRNGLRPLVRVAFLAFNSHPLLEGYYGVLEAGGILLPINVRLTAPEIAYILDDSGAKVLIADADFEATVREIMPLLRQPPELIWIGDVPPGMEGRDYDGWLADAPDVPPPPLAIDENEVAELFYTSGTTGKPKGVMLTHRNLYLHALGALATISVDDSDVQLHTIPLFHVNGWGTPQALTAVGGRHVMLRRFDPAEALRLIELERVTRFYAVPTMLNMLLNHVDVESTDTSSLRVVFLGGAATPPEMIRRAERLLGCKVMGGYGLSETSPVLSFAFDKARLVGQEEDARIRRQASTGLPVIGVDLRIVDDGGKDVPWDGQSVGEIVARSNVVMKGYWNDVAGSEAAIRDGWFYTGDMATVDPEGYFLIVDRKKDIIISGGENISSVEIEKLLFEHPAVLENAVIGVPDTQWGEVPVALVVLREGQSASKEDIIEFCRGRIAPFKIPKSIEFRAELPKGGTGKVLKADLRNSYWEDWRKRVN